MNKALLHVVHDTKCLVVKRTGQQVAWVGGRDVWYDDVAARVLVRLPARGK